MKYLKKHKAQMVLLILVLLAAVISLLTAVTGGASSPIANFFGVVLSPIRDGINALGQSAASAFNESYAIEILLNENEELRVKIAEIEEEMRRSEQILSENERLRQLLGLSERRRDFTFEIARVVGYDTSNWTSSFTIGRGTNDGLAVNMAVVSSELYLVGYISEAGATWSTVTTVIDTSMQAGAYLYRTKQQAVAEGDFNLMNQGLLKLSYLPLDGDVKVGDLVQTSGAGEVFPHDLVIGQVVGVHIEPSGLAAYASIAPAANLHGLEQVFVIKSFDISD